MSVWRQLKDGLRVLIHRAESDQGIIDEAEDFIDRRAEEFITRGLSPEEARRAFEAAVKLDPSNRQAADALSRLR